VVETFNSAEAFSNIRSEANRCGQLLEGIIGKQNHSIYLPTAASLPEKQNEYEENDYLIELEKHPQLRSNIALSAKNALEYSLLIERRALFDSLQNKLQQLVTISGPVHWLEAERDRLVESKKQ